MNPPADGVRTINTVEISGAGPTWIIYFWDIITKVYEHCSRNDAYLSTEKAPKATKGRIYSSVYSPARRKAAELYRPSSRITVTLRTTV